MKTRTFAHTLLALAAVATAQGRGFAPSHPASPAADRIQAAVCIDYDREARLVQTAQPVATRLLAATDVTLRWYTGFKSCPANALRISMQEHSSPSEHPRGLRLCRALRQSGESSTIRAFLDRVLASQPGGPESGNALPALLGHVLAHEIAHMLEGVVRHSDTGLMRAHWMAEDNRRMRTAPRAWDPTDIEMIHTGLVARLP